MTRKIALNMIITIYLILNVSISIAQDDIIDPLIYYYSVEQQAFVVETASGDMHSKLVDFQLCADCWITGSGWSISGEWFAWGTELLPTPAFPHENEQVYLTNTDGTELISLTSSNQRSRNPEWSPVSGLLLYEVYNVGEFIPSQYVVFDVLLNEQIWMWDVNSEILADVEWSTSGDIVVYSSTRETVGQADMTVYSLDGSQPYERDIRISWQSEGASCTPTWSMENEVVYISSQNELVLENDEQEMLRITEFTDTNILYTNWSPDSNYAVIYTSADCTQSFSVTSSAWLVSRENNSIMEISSEALFVPNDSPRRNIYNWSPDSNYWSGIFVRNNDIYEQLILETHLTQTGE